MSQYTLSFKRTDENGQEVSIEKKWEQPGATRNVPALQCPQQVNQMQQQPTCNCAKSMNPMMGMMQQQSMCNCGTHTNQMGMNMMPMPGVVALPVQQMCPAPMYQQPSIGCIQPMPLMPQGGMGVMPYGNPMGNPFQKFF